MRTVSVILLTLTLSLLHPCLNAHSLYDLSSLSEQQLEEDQLVEVE